MAFTGNNNEIGRPGIGDCRFNRAAPVLTLMHISKFIQADTHLLDDGSWIFAARIVAGEPQLVGVALCRLRHQRPFTGIAITAAANNTDQATLDVRRQRA